MEDKRIPREKVCRNIVAIGVKDGAITRVSYNGVRWLSFEGIRYRVKDLVNALVTSREFCGYVMDLLFHDWKGMKKC